MINFFENDEPSFSLVDFKKWLSAKKKKEKQDQKDESREKFKKKVKDEIKKRRDSSGETS